MSYNTVNQTKAEGREEGGLPPGRHAAPASFEDRGSLLLPTDEKVVRDGIPSARLVIEIA